MREYDVGSNGNTRSYRSHKAQGTERRREEARETARKRREPEAKRTGCGGPKRWTPEGFVSIIAWPSDYAPSIGAAPCVSVVPAFIFTKTSSLVPDSKTQHTSPDQMLRPGCVGVSTSRHLRQPPCVISLCRRPPPAPFGQPRTHHVERPGPRPIAEFFGAPQNLCFRVLPTPPGALIGDCGSTATHLTGPTALTPHRELWEGGKVGTIRA